jgi:hypothetical protein
MVVMMAVSATFTFASATCLRLPERRATAGKEKLNGFTDRASGLLVVNIDTDLLKTGKGPHAHASGKQDLDSTFFEKVDWRHAANLLVCRILEDRYFADRIVLDHDEREGRTVTEVFRNGGIEAVSSLRGNCNQHD